MFKTALGLVLAGFLLGDGLGLLGLAWVMFRDRHKGRVFWFLSALFLAVALFILTWISAGSEIPPEARTVTYRWAILAASIVLALGIWPAVLHIIFGMWRKDENTTLLARSGDESVTSWVERIGQIVRDERLTEVELRAAVRGELQDFFAENRA